MSCRVGVGWMGRARGGADGADQGAGAQCAVVQAAGVVPGPPLPPSPPPVAGGGALLSSPPQALNSRARHSAPAPSTGLYMRE
ncbi:hypothetical protein D3C86_1424890 [compost metagenome]